MFAPPFPIPSTRQLFELLHCVLGQWVVAQNRRRHPFQVSRILAAAVAEAAEGDGGYGASVGAAGAVESVVLTEMPNAPVASGGEPRSVEAKRRVRSF